MWVWLDQSLMYHYSCWSILVWRYFCDWFVVAFPVYPFCWWTRDHKKVMYKVYHHVTLIFFYLFTGKYKTLEFFFYIWRWDFSWLVVVYVLILIAWPFLGELVLILTIMMVKGVSVVSVEDWSNNVGRKCGCHVNVFYFKGLKDLLYCNFRVNVDLMYLWIAFKML